MASLLASQIPSLLLLLFGTFICGSLPVCVKNFLFRCNCNSDICMPTCRARRGKVIISLLICFGGGVLLGTTFIHLLPESREAFEQKPDPINCSLNAADDENEEHETFPIPEFIVCCGFFGVYLFEEILKFFLSGHTQVPCEEGGTRSDSTDTLPLINDGHSHLPTTFSLTGLLTVAALSFHSLFEGFAIGLQKTDYGTWIMFAAIAVHKFVIAFVVGLEVLATGGKDLHVYIYMSVFALMSPLGMGIAMITQYNIEDTNPMVVSTLNAISTGTLLYVTFFEILKRDDKRDITSWMQLIATATGFGVMCLMQYGSTFA